MNVNSGMAYYVVLGVVVLSVFYVLFNFIKIKSMREGILEMSTMAKTVRDGAATFMRTEYKTIVPIVIVLALIFSLFIEKTSGLTFLIGAMMSSAVCVLGMRGATYANVRTANKARETLSVGKTVKVALRGGSICGISVQAFGLLGLIAVLIIWGGIDPKAVGTGFWANLECNPSIMRITTYSLGCSLVAMFNRVAGGNFTKAADISADIVGKNRHDMPEDDARNPSVIADFVGDNVNDIAGNSSDLLESFVATVVAAIMIAVNVFLGNDIVSQDLLMKMIIYPLILAGGGLLGCVSGLAIAQKKHMGKDPSKELNFATYVSAGITIVIGLFGASLLFGRIELYDDFRLGWISPFVSAVLGIGSGVLIGAITEFYTSTDYGPTKRLAKIAKEGPAFVITKGDAIGSRSCLLPILIIGIAIFISGKICGKYGIAISALGMLAFVATTVSIDAFGPIADNAGGFAEACGLGDNVRRITDKLDSVGNTTAAIGKGFAIGSAAFATVSLIIAYVGNYTAAHQEEVLNIASFNVIVGTLIGGGLIWYFCALLSDNTINSAKKMAKESEKQLDNPDIMNGTQRPDYEKCIKLATSGAIRKMLLPSLLAIVVPFICGIFFGVEMVGGMLFGATITAIPLAIYMGNSGGAFDNAKKFIESGALPGQKKGSAAHKAAVAGDTVGDTRKDVVGVALDIFIKMMSTVANTLAPIFKAIH